jgi:hypothetical protein
MWRHIPATQEAEARLGKMLWRPYRKSKIQKRLAEQFPSIHEACGLNLSSGGEKTQNKNLVI